MPTQGEKGEGKSKGIKLAIRPLLSPQGSGELTIGFRQVTLVSKEREKVKCRLMNLGKLCPLSWV